VTAALFASPEPEGLLTRSTDLSRALRTAVVLWLAIGAAISVRTLVRPASHTVFPIFAGAAERWWTDQPLYSDYKPLDYFRYPPPSALFFSPFAALGLRAGGVLWTWIGLASYASGLWRFRREVLPSWWWTPRREIAFLALATLGALAGLWNGQSNALVAGLVLWAAAALVRGRDWTSAICLAAAVCVKLTPLPLVLLLCALWPRRLAGRFALAVAALVLVPFLTRPPEMVLHHYSDWIAQQGSLAHERWPGFRDGWTVWQVARHTFAIDGGPIALKEPLDSSGYRALQLAAALGCLAWCLAQRWGTAARSQVVLRTLSMGAAWIMLFGPAIEYPTYVFLAPFLAAAVVDPEGGMAGRVLAMTASALILGLGWGSISLRIVPVFPAVLAALPAGTALFALGLGLSRRQQRSLLAYTWRHETEGSFTSAAA
jgi:glycosyl transferase family 87